MARRGAASNRPAHDRALVRRRSVSFSLLPATCLGWRFVGLDGTGIAADPHGASFLVVPVLVFGFFRDSITSGVRESRLSCGNRRRICRRIAARIGARQEGGSSRRTASTSAAGHARTAGHRLDLVRVL